MKWIDGGVCAPRGFAAAGVRAGIKQQGLDVALVVADRPCTAAGVFTQNAFISPAARYSREVVRCGKPVVATFGNSGCANACTGPEGEQDLQAIVNTVKQALARHRPGLVGEVLAAQTGIIGVRLFPERMAQPIDEAVAKAGPEGWQDAARAIMTTDTRPKACAVEAQIEGRAVHIGGMAKGSGMIAPNMATMHVYLTTDIAAQAAILQPLLGDVVGRSFNTISVDGDGSTSDCVLMLANGAAGAALSEANRSALAEALNAVCERLARELVADGEGATRVIEVRVTGARTDADAALGARAIAESLLVKTAVFGGDPNWGRIAAALGRSGAEVDPYRTTIRVGDVLLFESGAPTAFDRASAEAAVRCDEVVIAVDLGLGEGASRMLSCDLSYDYVRINAEYHT